jgi:glycosyltransferase involved in cell wall biosynthesis
MKKIRLKKLLRRFTQLRLRTGSVIVIDDCSQDGTQPVLKEKVSQMVDRIIYYPVNRGKGIALRSRFGATGDIILVRDAHLECSPGD